MYSTEYTVLPIRRTIHVFSYRHSQVPPILRLSTTFPFAVLSQRYSSYLVASPHPLAERCKPLMGASIGQQNVGNKQKKSLTDRLPHPSTQQVQSQAETTSFHPNAAAPNGGPPAQRIVNRANIIWKKCATNKSTVRPSITSKICEVFIFNKSLPSRFLNVDIYD